MVRAVVAVEAEEDRDDLATCARARWRRSEVDTACHHAVDERLGQKEDEHQPKGVKTSLETPSIDPLPMGLGLPPNL